MKLKSFSDSFLNLLLFSAALFCLVGTTSFEVMAQKTSDDLQISFAPEASVAPAINPDGNKNPSCATLNNSGDPRFAHITSNSSLKLDQGSPNGTFTFTNGPDRELVGNSDPDNSVTISSSGAIINSFSSTKTITAVIVKGGNEGANVYPYSPGTTFDSNLTTIDPQNGISHVTFCYNSAINPTSAPATVSGRIADENGKPASRVFVTAINLSTGEYLQTLTNMFGRYKFENLPTGENYLVTVSSRKYTFTPNNRIISLVENLNGLDFVAAQKENMLW
jgi:hypothetical protein